MSNTEKTQLADERAYLYDDEALGIEATDKENKHWNRWKGRYRKCIELTGKKGGNWLDAACGSGYGSEMMLETADQVTGVDLDSNTIEYAKKYHGKSDQITFLNRDIASMEFNPSSYDAIVSIETIEHIADATTFLTSVNRLLKEDGVFVVTTPESQYGGGPNPDNVFHLQEYTREQFQDLLSKYFEQVEITWDEAVFSTGIKTTQLYAVCRTPKK